MARSELCAALAWVAFAKPETTQYLYDQIANSWLNTGQRDIDWEDCWYKSTQALRKEFGIGPFESAFPADTIEQAMANLRLILTRFRL